MKFVKHKDKKLTDIQKPLFFFFNLIPSNAKRQNFCVRREPQSTLIIKLTHTVFTLRARCPSTERREKGQKFNSLFFLSLISCKDKNYGRAETGRGEERHIPHWTEPTGPKHKQKKQICISYRCIRIDICIYIYSQTCYLLYFIIKYIITVYFFFYQPSAKKYKQHHRLCKGKKRPFFQKF